MQTRRMAGPKGDLQLNEQNPQAHPKVRTCSTLLYPLIIHSILGNSPHVKHRYGTRRSTRTVRPHALGHHKRTEDDSSQAAAENFAAKESQRDLRARKAQQRTQGMKELARLEDERIAEEAAEDEAICAPAKGASARISHNTSPMSAASSRANQQVRICVHILPAHIAYVLWHFALALAPSARSSMFTRTVVIPPSCSVHLGAGTRHPVRKTTSRRP